MSVNFYLSHKMAIRVLSIFMVVLMLIACASSPAHAVGEVIGLPLIAAILSAFGVSSVATGTVDGMLDGLDQLMGDFSESLSHTRDWFRSLFDADTFVSSYGRLGIAGTLVDSIKLFITWLKTEKGLSASTPIVSGGGSFLSFSGFNFPVFYWDSSNSQNKSYTFGSQTWFYPAEGTSFLLSNYAEYLDVSSVSSSSDTYFGSYICVRYTWPTSNNPYEFSYYGGSWTTGLGSKLFSGFLPVVCLARPYQDSYRYYLVVLTDGYRSNLGDAFSYHGSSQIRNPVLEETSGWQINDDNLDLDYLENDDGSTKDVIFAPSFTDVRNPDLSTLDKWNDAAREQLDQSKTLTGEGEATGEISTNVDFDPGSGGSGNVPPIVIPSHGWFRSIWHYVVKALQDSADGIAFIIHLMQETIPPEILNLCWASAVLLIVFGIINKFLK